MPSADRERANMAKARGGSQCLAQLAHLSWKDFIHHYHRMWLLRAGRERIREMMGKELPFDFFLKQIALFFFPSH